MALGQNNRALHQAHNLPEPNAETDRRPLGWFRAVLESLRRSAALEKSTIWKGLIRLIKPLGVGRVINRPFDRNPLAKSLSGGLALIWTLARHS